MDGFGQVKLDMPNRVVKEIVVYVKQSPEKSLGL